MSKCNKQVAVTKLDLAWAQTCVGAEVTLHDMQEFKSDYQSWLLHVAQQQQALTLEEKSG